MQTKRGGFLTTMTILLALVALEDVLKPFGRQGPTTPGSFLPRIQPGIVVLGVRHTARTRLSWNRWWKRFSFFIRLAYGA